MKKYLAVVLTLLLMGATLVHAEETENVTKRRPDGAVNPQIQEIKADIKDAREERKSAIQTMQAARLNRFDSYYKLLSNIIARFKLRRDELSSKGKDVTALTAKITLAEQTLASAKAKSDAFATALAGLSSTSTKDDRLAAAKLAKEAHDLYKETHRILVQEGMRLLKTFSKPALPAASAAVQNAQ